MTAHPMPCDRVSGRGSDQLDPKLQVLNLTRLALPASRRPAMDPILHPVREVVAVRVEGEAACSSEQTEPFYRAAQRHTVVGRVGFGDVIVVARPAALRVELFDQTGCAAGRRSVAELIAETGFVGVDVYQTRNGRIVHGIPF